MNDNYSGTFVVFEGGEGSGKSTQAKKLAKALESEGVPHLLTHEPGGSALGYELRNLLLDSEREPISKKAEALLFMADRAEHVEKVVLPALREGRVVISDRYIASTIAYQAYAGGLPIDIIEAFSNWASGYLYPDITFYLDIDPGIGLQRALLRGKGNRIDVESITYHELVRKGFRQQADDTWVSIDARDTVFKIHIDVLMRVKMLLQEKVIHEDTRDGMKRKPEECPTCNGWVLVKDRWVRSRETVDMICKTCGKDYMQPDEDGHGSAQ